MVTIGHRTPALTLLQNLRVCIIIEVVEDPAELNRCLARTASRQTVVSASRESWMVKKKLSFAKANASNGIIEVARVYPGNSSPHSHLATHRSTVYPAAIRPSNKKLLS